MSGYDASQFAIELARLAADDKCSDLIVLDLRGLSAVMDFVVVATGTSQRQLRAVSEHIVAYGKRIGRRPYGICGQDSASWVLVDYVDVVFHGFAKAYREYYDLELLWGDAAKLDWSRAESA